MADSPEKKKYQPLGEHLAGLGPTQTELALSFAEVEKIIGEELPPSAFKHREWWSNQKGGSRAPHWRAAGFAVIHADLTRRIVRFQRLGAPDGAPLAMTLQEVVTAVNERAKGRPIGGLPEWRRKHKGVGRPRATVFPSAVGPSAGWVAHNGARGHGEMQFNVGFDWDDGVDMFRHGIAFSLETSRTFTDVEPLVRKIGRFNEYLRIYPNAFEGFSMWVWDERTSTPRDRARIVSRRVVYES